MTTFHTWRAQIAAGKRLNAAAFIVTIYGDVVVPRGGVLWTRSLIELCAQVGISESLVRTAVSRLVAAGQLEGERAGRRSFYRLAAGAGAAFREAADLLYGPDQPAEGWQVVHAPELRPEEARRARMGHVGGPVFIRPDRGQAPPAGSTVFHAGAISGEGDVARFWDLDLIREGYARFIALFSPLLQSEMSAIADADALTIRLLLVDAYRRVLLKDPRLPAAHLPAGWNGGEARALFRRLYLATAQAADRRIAACCEGAAGPLLAQTMETASRFGGTG